MQRNFAAFRHSRFSQDMKYHYDNLLERLNLLTLHNRRRQFDALFLINVFNGTKCCPSVFEIVGTFLALLVTAFQLDAFQLQI
jgi:hypothetical protein